MRYARMTATVAVLTVLSAPLLAQESKAAKPPSGDTWTRVLVQRGERGSLSDRSEAVRGDTGKWNDAPRLQRVSRLEQKPSGKTLDDWVDAMAGEQAKATVSDDHWLVVRTQQLDDNDRVWVERIERRGNEFVVVLNHVVWRGRYFKNFTFYQVEAMNLGRLAPGSYKARCVIRTLEFSKFEDPGQPKDNWPKDERPSTRKPAELSVAFTVTAAK